MFAAVAFAENDNSNVIFTGADDSLIFVWDRRYVLLDASSPPLLSSLPLLLPSFLWYTSSSFVTGRFLGTRVNQVASWQGTPKASLTSHRKEMVCKGEDRREKRSKGDISLSTRVHSYVSSRLLSLSLSLLSPFCPTLPGRYLVSNSKDQTMKMWDIRKIMSISQYNSCSKPKKYYKYKTVFLLSSIPLCRFPSLLLSDCSCSSSFSCCVLIFFLGFSWDYRGMDYPGNPEKDR